MGGKKAKKPKGPTKAELEAKKKAEEELTATKGKDATFFAVNGGQPNQEQMMFVYQYYPQYSYNPSDIITWCYHEATRLAKMESLANEANEGAYGTGSRGSRPS